MNHENLYCNIEFALHLLSIDLVITSKMLIHKWSAGTVSALLLEHTVMGAVATAAVTMLRMRI